MHSAQLASSIDLRLRRLTSTLIWAVRPDDEGFHYVFFTPDGTYHRTINMELARRLFTTYDTHELVIEEEDEETAEEPSVEKPESEFNVYVKQLEEMQKSFAKVTSRFVKQINSLQTELEESKNRLKKLEVVVQQANKKATKP